MKKIIIKSDFEYFDRDGFYTLNLGVIRFKITEVTYECLVTNLTRDEFDLEELKKIYHMHWDIETAFRVLKYFIGMTSFCSKKCHFIQQKIYAAILLHYLANIITESVEIEQSDTWKRPYKTNLSSVVTDISQWLRKRIDTEKMVKRIKNIWPR